MFDRGEGGGGGVQCVRSKLITTNFILRFLNQQKSVTTVCHETNNNVFTSDRAVFLIP